VRQLPSLGFGSDKVVPLTFHVDYWDRLGWKDPFATRAFTGRQEWYADSGRLRSPDGSAGLDGLYTPQMIVDGAVHFSGQRREVALREMQRAGLRPPELDLAAAVSDPFDADAVAVEPLPAQKRILDALSRLGFTFREAVLEQGRVDGAHLDPDAGEPIRFTPSPRFASVFSQVAVTFLTSAERTDVVLERLRRRAADPAWDTIVAGILLQRDAGGDLAGLLRRFAVAAAERERILADARSATAQARFTGLLVVAMPAGAALFAELIEPGFMAALLAKGASLALLAVAAPFLAQHFGLFACMMVAGTAALLYARDLARGYIMGALGGFVIGAACGLAAGGTANLLGDHPDEFLPYGVMILALIGAIGGLFGQYAAWIREFIATLRQ